MEVEALVRLCKRTAAARQVGRGKIGEGMCKRCDFGGTG